MQVQKIRANKKVKKGDVVEVITGKSKGKSGKVTKIMGKFSMCLIEKVNLVKKHAKPSQENPQGGIIQIEAPIHLSNVRKLDGIAVKSIKKKAPTKKTTKKKTAKKTTANKKD